MFVFFTNVHEHIIGHLSMLVFVLGLFKDELQIDQWSEIPLAPSWMSVFKNLTSAFSKLQTLVPVCITHVMNIQLGF